MYCNCYELGTLLLPLLPLANINTVLMKGPALYIEKEGHSPSPEAVLLLCPSPG